MTFLIASRVIDGVLWVHDGSRPLNEQELQAVAELANERAQKQRLAQLEAQASQATDLGPLVKAVWSEDKQMFDWAWADGSGLLAPELLLYLRQQVLAKRGAAAPSPFVVGPA